MHEKLSVYRSEDKYVIDHVTASRLKNDLRKVLSQDVHSAVGGYCVRSLYFDSINNKDYNQKYAGVEKRKKIRIRTYDIASDICKLEMKEKTGNYQHKTSLIINREIAFELINCNYSVLLGMSKSIDTASIFYKEMMLGVYRPATLIEYKRIAFTHNLNNTRLTFDYEIKSSEKCTEFFSDKVSSYVPVLDEQEVFEVKYDGKLLKYISKVLQPYNLTQLSYSKYTNGRAYWCDFL